MFINMAWENLIDIYNLKNEYEAIELRLSECKNNDRQDEQTEEDIFIYTSQLERMSSSVDYMFQMIDTLIAQSIEFYLKARIADFSPYILISHNYKKWTGKDQIFSDMYMIEAQHLLNTLNTLVKEDEKLDDNFIRIYKEVKKERNSFIHSISRNESIDIKSEVKKSALNILMLYKYIDRDDWTKWSDSREDYLKKHSPYFGDQSPYDPHENVVSDIIILLNLLSPSESDEYLNFHPKNHGRNYFCQSCCVCDQTKREDTFFSKIKEGDGEYVQCCICGHIDHIKRAKCVNDDCKGDVISIKSKMCLTCLEWQNPSDDTQQLAEPDSPTS
jgi:hypothetical protein